MDLAKRFENKDDTQANYITNKTRNPANPNKLETNDCDSINPKDLNLIPRNSGRVSAILNKINNNLDSDRKELKNTNQKEEINIRNIKENTENMYVNIKNQDIVKSKDTLQLNSNLNTIERNEEINYGNQNAIFINNKEIEKISDDSMIQDFKNLLKFKKKTSDPFDMEYSLNYKAKDSKNELELYPINSKDIITFEEAEQIKFIENESDKSENLEVEDIDKEIENVEDLEDSFPRKENKDKLKNKSFKITNIEEPELKGRNSTFKFKPKNSLGKKPLNLNIESIETNLNLNSITNSNQKTKIISENKESNKDPDADLEINMFKHILKNKNIEDKNILTNNNIKSSNNLTNNISNLEVSECTLTNAIADLNQNKTVSNIRKSAKENFELKNKKDIIEGNLADENKSNISDNLSRSSIISLERKSVKFYVKKIEKAVRKQQFEQNSIEKKRRNTHSHKIKKKRNNDIFNENLQEIRDILVKLKLQTAEDEKEFLEKNRDLLKKMGVHEKDMLSIKELTNYFEEKLASNNPKASNDDLFKYNSLKDFDKFNSNEIEKLNIDNYAFKNDDNHIEDIKKRNTTNHTRKLYEDVSLILEEKDEDSSFMFKEKERISDNNKQKPSDKSHINNINSIVSPNNINKSLGLKNSNSPLNIKASSSLTPTINTINYDALIDNEKNNLELNYNNHKSARVVSFPFKDKNDLFPNKKNEDIVERNLESIIFKKDKSNNFIQEKPEENNKFAIRNLSSNEMDLFNADKDQIECYSPKNVFFEISKIKQNNDIYSNDKNDNFNHISKESQNNTIEKEENFSISYKKSELISTKENLVISSTNNLEFEKKASSKIFDDKRLSTNNVETINFKPCKKSFNEETFIIDNLSNTPRKTNIISFIVENIKNKLKVELINNFMIEGNKKKKEISITNITICKENDHVFEIVSSSNNNNDITKASSFNYNANLNNSLIKNIYEKANNANGTFF